MHAPATSTTDAVEWLTTAQAAARIGISPRALRRMIERGTAPRHLRINRRSWRWRASDVDGWVRARECGGGAHGDNGSARDDAREATR